MKDSSDERFIGIKATLIIVFFFVLLELFVQNLIQGFPILIFDSVLRLVFGAICLVVVFKLFGRTPGNVLKFRNNGHALLSGVGVLGFLCFYVVCLAIGFSGITGLTAGLFLAEIVFQQIGAGFFEELLFRVLFCEGFFYSKDTKTNRLIYALTGSVIFGLLHCLGGWYWWTFLFTSVFGLAMSTIYMLSKNIAIPMIIHFLVDFFGHSEGYIVTRSDQTILSLNIRVVAVVLMALASLAMLLFAKNRSGMGK
ncbi:MAG: CPBP family intramembrane metalloprotease [Lachnospiraceae bacterium]|nr:CPBP family intramembrane metalloprotease [Lachnospiraceae bacterium]